MIDQLLHLPNMISSFDQSQIQHGARGGGDYISRQRADVAAAEAVDVQRRLIDKFEQSFARAFRARETQLRPQLVIISRSFSDRFLFRFAQGLDAFMPSAIVTRPASSFIEASRRASSMAGFGAQF